MQRPTRQTVWFWSVPGGFGAWRTWKPRLMCRIERFRGFPWTCRAQMKLTATEPCPFLWTLTIRLSWYPSQPPLKHCPLFHPKPWSENSDPPLSFLSSPKLPLTPLSSDNTATEVKFGGANCSFTELIFAPEVLYLTDLRLVVLHDV